jgi:hypothetical protein
MSHSGLVLIGESMIVPEALYKAWINLPDNLKHKYCIKVFKKYPEVLRWWWKECRLPGQLTSIKFISSPSNIKPACMIFDKVVSHDDENKIKSFIGLVREIDDKIKYGITHQIQSNYNSSKMEVITKYLRETDFEYTDIYCEYLKWTSAEVTTPEPGLVFDILVKYNEFKDSCERMQQILSQAFILKELNKGEAVASLNGLITIHTKLYADFHSRIDNLGIEIPDWETPEELEQVFAQIQERENEINTAERTKIYLLLGEYLQQCDIMHNSQRKLEQYSRIKDDAYIELTKVTPDCLPESFPFSDCNSADEWFANFYGISGGLFDESVELLRKRFPSFAHLLEDLDRTNIHYKLGAGTFIDAAKLNEPLISPIGHTTAEKPSNETHEPLVMAPEMKSSIILPFDNEDSPVIQKKPEEAQIVGDIFPDPEHVSEATRNGNQYLSNTEFTAKITEDDISDEADFDEPPLIVETSEQNTIDNVLRAITPYCERSEFASASLLFSAESIINDQLDPLNAAFEALYYSTNALSGDPLPIEPPAWVAVPENVSVVHEDIARLVFFTSIQQCQKGSSMVWWNFHDTIEGFLEKFNMLPVVRNFADVCWEVSKLNGMWNLIARGGEVTDAESCKANIQDFIEEYALMQSMRKSRNCAYINRIKIQLCEREDLKSFYNAVSNLDVARSPSVVLNTMRNFLMTSPEARCDGWIGENKDIQGYERQAVIKGLEKFVEQVHKALTAVETLTMNKGTDTPQRASDLRAELSRQKDEVLQIANGNIWLPFVAAIFSEANL